MERSVKSRLAYTGNFLIIAACLLLIGIYSPVIKAYTQPPVKHHTAAPVPTVHNYLITIPKINAQAPIIRNVDPFNKEKYLAALEKGVAQTNSSVDAGENGETFLFAHSSLPPWQMTRLNTSFLRLGELGKGDTIEVEKDGHVYKYVVMDTKVVNPEDTQYLKKENFKGLVLQTCTPIGTDWNRLLVFAVLRS